MLRGGLRPSLTLEPRQIYTTGTFLHVQPDFPELTFYALDSDAVLGTVGENSPETAREEQPLPQSQPFPPDCELLKG